MKKYMLVNIFLLLVGIVVIILFKDTTNVVYAFMKFIGLCLTLISAFLIICYFFGITLNKLE
jgi:hypothetical protein